MKRGWTEVALGEVLEPKTDNCPILPEVEYMEVTVSLWGRGIRLRKRILGSEITAVARNQTATGDFIISKIDARHGAYGFIPKELAGAVVSNDFPLFRVCSETLSPRWLYWISKSSFFVDLCRRASKGTTNRVRLKESLFLNLKIPLPPLAEQQRIVAHLDAIEERLDRIQKLREESEKELLAALRSAFHKIEAESEWLEMGEVAPLVRRPIDIDPVGNYPELGARSFGKGIFHKPTLRGCDLTWQKLFRVHSGDIVISNIKAWEGAIAVATKHDDGRVGSHRYLTCVPNPERALPEFIGFYLLTHDGLEKVGLASPGSADRNRTLAASRLEKITVPIPSLEKQRDFLKLLKLKDSILEQRAKAIIRNDALLPSLLDQIFDS